jgi:hypothetical protein
MHHSSWNLTATFFQTRNFFHKTHLQFQQALQQVVERPTGIETCVTGDTGSFKLIFGITRILQKQII